MSTNCPRCGSLNEQHAVTCAFCGTALPAQAGPRAPIPLAPRAAGVASVPAFAGAAAFAGPPGFAGPSSLVALPPSKSADLILILGVVAFFVPILAPVAWLLGQTERNKIKRGEIAPSSSVTAGWALGLVLTCIYALVFLFVVPALMNLLSS